MTGGDELNREISAFKKRVAELRSTRGLPAGSHPSTLDAALLELGLAVDTLLPGIEQQLAARRADEGETSRELQLLRAVFQRLPQPAVLLDGEGLVRRLNFAAARVFGMRAGYATGRPLANAVAHASRASLHSQVAAVARGEGDRSVDVDLIGVEDTDGRGLTASLTALRVPGEPRAVVLAVFGPPGRSQSAAARVTRGAPRPELAEASRNAELMDLLDTMTTTLVSAHADAPPVRLTRAAGVLHERFADWVVGDLLTSGGGRLHRVVVLAPAGSEPLAEDIRAQEPDSAPLISEAARAGVRSLQIRPQDPDALGIASDGEAVLEVAGVTSLLCVPLLLPSGTVRGVLTLLRCGGRRAFALAEAGAMDRMSRHIALALHAV
ncbi:PAS domain-containing protein [Streptomyces sp. NPDC051940]|uniref:PAS domain-containing protein n=1 Tax=Streptomyces sp. NPDC051940 TaxID=3155675 RepID=UPI0034404E54